MRYISVAWQFDCDCAFLQFIFTALINWQNELPASSSVRITDRSVQYASPRIWSQLPASLRQPRTNLSNSDSPILQVALLSLVPLTHHSHHPSPPHSFIPGLKPSCIANHSKRNLPVLQEKVAFRSISYERSILHCVSKKQDTRLLPITSPNVNRFSKFFHW